MVAGAAESGATLSSEHSHRYFACPSQQRCPCLNSELFHQRTVARRKPCLRGSEEDQATGPRAVTKRSLPNESITVAGTSDSTYWGGGQPHVGNTACEVSVRPTRTENRRAGGAGLGLGGELGWGRTRHRSSGQTLRSPSLAVLARHISEGQSSDQIWTPSQQRPCHRQSCRAWTS